MSPLNFDVTAQGRSVAMDRKTALERAFARSGSCLSIRDIASKLHSEKYDVSYLEGPALKKQLLALIEEAVKPKAP